MDSYKAMSTIHTILLTIGSIGGYTSLYQLYKGRYQLKLHKVKITEDGFTIEIENTGDKPLSVEKIEISGLTPSSKNCIISTEILNNPSERKLDPSSPKVLNIKCHPSIVPLWFLKIKIKTSKTKCKCYRFRNFTDAMAKKQLSVFIFTIEKIKFKYFNQV